MPTDLLVANPPKQITISPMPEIRYEAEDSFFRYLAYSAEDEKWRMVCTDAGFCVAKPHAAYPPEEQRHPDQFQQVSVGRTLREYQIVYIAGGRGSLRILDEDHRLLPGTAFLILPGLKHHYKPDIDTGWTEYWVGFKGPYFDELLAGGALSARRLVYEAGLQNVLLTGFRQIFDEIKQQRPLYQIKVCSLILGILAEILAAERRRDQPNHYLPIVEKAKFLMEQNILGNIDLADIAADIGVSSSRLNEIFKTSTAMTPHQYFIHLKILYAKSMLEREDSTVKETAFQLGFGDPYYFSRLFKNKTGVAPSEWRRYVFQ